jgi:hypothetical protein
LLVRNWAKWMRLSSDDWSASVPLADSVKANASLQEMLALPSLRRHLAPVDYEVRRTNQQTRQSAVLLRKSERLFPLALSWANVHSPDQSCQSHRSFLRAAIVEVNIVVKEVSRLGHCAGQIIDRN